MSRAGGGWSDERVEQIVGNLLRAGVVLAATVVAVGGVIYLARHGREPAGHHTFEGEPADFRSVTGIVENARHLGGRGIIQLGLLLLIATPVARVVFSVFAFARQRDSTYVGITLIVLCILLYSLFSGRLGGG
jgi:uncharacterized membrane protein